MKFINAYNVEYLPSEFLSYDDVLIIPQYSEVQSRNDPNLNLVTKFTKKFKLKNPILSANMDTISGPEMVIAMASLGCYGILHRFFKTETEFLDACKQVIIATNALAFSVGADPNDCYSIEKVYNLLKEMGRENTPLVVCIDIAHGHSIKCITQVKTIKKHFPNIEVIAGNVATAIGASDLIEAGADGIKVGIGGGSLCSTRVVTGSGLPTLSSILQCRMAINAHKKNIALIADGGIRNSGDIVKALAAGADTVMIGGLLSGTTETPGNLFIKDQDNFIPCTKAEDFHQTPKYKKYRGQSSLDFLEDIKRNDVAPEGESKFVEIKGSAVDITKNLIMGVRSGLTYSGVTNLEQLSEKAIMAVITNHGFNEGQPHGLKS